MRIEPNTAYRYNPNRVYGACNSLKHHLSIKGSRPCLDFRASETALVRGARGIRAPARESGYGGSLSKGSCNLGTSRDGMSVMARIHIDTNPS